PRTGRVHSRPTTRSKQLAQTLVAGAAHRNPRPVLEHDDATVFPVRLDAREALEIDDVAPMHAHETHRIEQRGELAERLLLDPFASRGGDLHVVILRFDVIDALHWHDVDRAAVTKRDALQRLANAAQRIRERL